MDVHAVKLIESLHEENKRLREALQYCREYWGEVVDGEGCYHDCTGKSCVICKIEQITKDKQ
jgi:hypothetical protein